jgi:hypothetical protein
MRTNELARQAKRSADANKEAADAAKSAADTAKDAMHISESLAQLSERAWLGTYKTELKLSHQPKPGEQVPFVGELLEARVEFLNTGRTPALNVRIATDGFVAPIEFGPKGEQYVGVGLTRYDDSNYQFGGNIPPGGAIYRDVRMWPQPTTQQNALDLQKPTHLAFIQGRGMYCDVVNPNVTHWFTFRFFLTLSGGEPAFAVYPVFNELGDENRPCHGR